MTITSGAVTTAEYRVLASKTYRLPATFVAVWLFIDPVPSHSMPRSSASLADGKSLGRKRIPMGFLLLYNIEQQPSRPRVRVRAAHPLVCAVQRGIRVFCLVRLDR